MLSTTSTKFQQIDNQQNQYLWNELALVSASLSAKTEDLKPNYIKKIYDCKRSMEIGQSNDHSYLFKTIKKIMGTPFERKISSILKINRMTRKPKSEMTITNLTHRSLTLPNLDAMKLIAHKYARKYQIPIMVSKLEEVFDIFECFKLQSRNRNFYIGIVIMDDRHPDHAVALLSHFGLHEETQTPLIECALMDSFGFIDNEQPLHPLYKKTIKYFEQIQLNRLYLSVSQCQSLPYLGPTRAIVLLRNVLLDLQYSNSSQPLHALLQEYLIEGTCYFEELPPQWSYTDQRVDNRGDDLAVTRDFFSRSFCGNINKSEKPLSLEDFRIQHQSKVVTECALTLKGINLLQKFNNISIPKGFTLRYNSPSECTVVFKVTETSFGYLFKKALRNQKELNEMYKLKFYPSLRLRDDFSHHALCNQYGSKVVKNNAIEILPKFERNTRKIRKIIEIVEIEEIE